MRIARWVSGVLGVVGPALAAAACCGRGAEVSREPEGAPSASALASAPASASAVGAQAKRGPGVRQLEAGAAPFEAKFPNETLLPSPAFEVTLGPAAGAKVVFVRGSSASPESPSWLGVVQGERRQLVPLTLSNEGAVSEVEAFDARDTDGDGRPELLLIARFEPQGSPAPPPFRRAFQIELDPRGGPHKSLASHELRDEATLSTLDELESALARRRRAPHCPPLSARMEADTTVAALRCMVEGGHKEQLAASVRYPLPVLLPSGEVRELTGPEKLAEVYDQVIDGAARKALQEASEPEAFYEGVRVGPLMLSQSLYVTPVFPHEAPKIYAIFSADAGAHQKLRERLATDQRSLWQGRRAEILCRTKRATHAFYRDKEDRLSLATWDNPKASPTQTPPDRIRFGYLASHGTCGNDFYEFIGPAGVAKLSSISCYGPEPTPKHAVTDVSEEEPCLNHPILR